MKKLLISIVLLLFLAGCITTSTPVPPSAELEALRVQNEVLGAQIAGLEVQVEDLSGQVSALQTENADLKAQLIALQPTAEVSLETRLKATSLEILSAIAARDFISLAAYVDPQKGLRFSPYGLINTAGDLVFTRDEVSQFAQDPAVYTWGIHPARGDDITIPVAEYWTLYVHPIDYGTSARVFYDEPGYISATIDNFFEVYPAGHYVQYFYPGTEQNGNLDYLALRMAFEQNADGSWYLVGLSHEYWTP